MDIFSPERWPSIAKVAREALGASDWQIRKWRTRRAIPGSRHLELLAACSAAGVPLSPDELLSTQSRKVAA